MARIALLMFMGTKLGLREKGTKEVTEFHSRPEIGGCLIGKSIRALSWALTKQPAIDKGHGDIGETRDVAIVGQVALIAGLHLHIW